ncbi:MAG: DEAD/DEAH box helicase [Vulcanimicrobiaceae bacterium]
MRAVADLGFYEATPIQVSAIPPAVAGRDVLASAPTGSGKSAAFGLPLLNALADLPRGKTRCLILAPTRELAAQICEHLQSLARHTGVKVAAIYGGVGFGPQVGVFRRGTDVVVATPGRLLDHLSQGTATLDGIEILVLDEADRMLDMGFLPDVRRVLKRLPTKRQTLFFSATIPPQIAELTKELLHDPVRVDLARSGAPAVGITQTIYTIDQQRKADLLLELLKDNNIFSAIAFTRTKSRANRLAAMLAKANVPADRIHGDRSQAQRTRALDDFKRGKYRVLVATDIAARGIDIAELGHVINFDVPMVAEDYIHRVGRTARAKATGDAITFVAADEEKYFSQIERALGRRLDRAKTPDLPTVSAVAPMPSGVQRQRSSAPRRPLSAPTARPRHAQPKGPSHAGSGRPFRPMPAAGGGTRTD